MTKKLPSSRAKAFMKWMDGQGTNTRQVSIKSGVPYSTLASFVQGDTQSLKGERETKITDAYRCSADEIFGGSAVEDRDTLVIPVISWVAAGKLVDPDSHLPAETETIEISGLPAGDYFGTRARGDSMNRVAPDGALIIVNRAEREPVRGGRYIFASRGKTTFKRFGGSDPYRLEPESLNPENEIIFPKDGETWEVIGRVRLVVTEL